jgi:hypothetical protein
MVWAIWGWIPALRARKRGVNLENETVRLDPWSRGDLRTGASGAKPVRYSILCTFLHDSDVNDVLNPLRLV